MASIQSTAAARTASSLRFRSEMRCFERPQTLRARLHSQQQVAMEKSLQQGADSGPSALCILSSWEVVSEIFS